MKILISYFYQIRFFKPHMIPLSTAIYDPKWFHAGKGNDYHYKDKNGVYNGLRADPFVPVMVENEECCGRENCTFSYENCDFLKNYYNQLRKLDFAEILKRFARLGYFIKDTEKFAQEPIMVLIVYETPDNPCSERQMLIKWFLENGYYLEEFNKNNF